MNRRLGVILSYAMMAIEVLSTLLLTPFIIRVLGQAEYGVYKLSAAIVAYLLLLDLGLGNSVIRYISKYRASGDIIQSRRFMGVATLYYAFITIITLLIGAILVIVYPNVFAKGLTQSEIILGQKLLVITVVNSAITLLTSPYSNTIIAYEKFLISKGCVIAQILLRMILTIIVLNSGMKSIGIVSVNLLLTILCRSFFVVYVLFVIKLRPLFKGINFEFIKEIFVYSSFILLQMLATQINAFADQIMLGALVASSSTIIAIYSIGTQIVQYYQSIGTSITSVLMPGVVKIVEKGAKPEQLCQEMVRIGRFIFIVLAFIWVCFIVFGEQFIILWSGNEMKDAYFVTSILITAYMFILTETIGSQILWAKNKHKVQSILKIAIVGLNVFFTAILIKWNPMVGATIGTFISLFLGDVVIMNIVFHKQIGINLKEYYRELFHGILQCIIVVFFSGIFIKQFQMSGWLGLVCSILILTLEYIFCMWKFGFNKYEKSLIESIIKDH